MAIFTVPELDEQISAFKKALLALAVSQSYKLGGREYVRADLPEVRETLQFLDLERCKLTGGFGWGVPLLYPEEGGAGAGDLVACAGDEVPGPFGLS
jgi:hypothetical protein